MASRMTSTTVYLYREQARALRKITQQTGIPMSVIIRRGIDMAIADVLVQKEANKGPFNQAWMGLDNEQQ